MLLVIDEAHALEAKARDTCIADARAASPPASHGTDPGRTPTARVGRSVDRYTDDFNGASANQRRLDIDHTDEVARNAVQDILDSVGVSPHQPGHSTTPTTGYTTRPSPR